MLTYGPTIIIFFQNCLAILGICLGIMTGHFEAIKKIKKNEDFTFSKVVYRPLGYYLLSSLLIFSPEANIFKVEKQIKTNICILIF